MKPDFDAEERYVIAFYKSERLRGTWLGYCIVCVLIVCLYVYGIGIGDEGVMLWAFGILVLFDIWKLRGQARSLRTIRSIFDKYEKGIEDMTKECG